MLNIDFSSVPSREPLPDGLYEAVIDKVEHQKSGKGLEMLQIDFKANERNVRGWFMLEGGGMFKTVELMKAIGFDTTGSVQFEPNDLLGQSVTLDLTTRELDSGDTVNDIKKIL